MSALNLETRPREVVKLTGRELDVLRLVDVGHKSQEAADILFVSKRTVDFHLANVFEKLKVGNRMAALRQARALGMLAFDR